jgi:hypothetical protein
MAGLVVLGPTTGEFNAVGHDVPTRVVTASKPSRRPTQPGGLEISIQQRDMRRPDVRLTPPSDVRAGGDQRAA